MTFNSSTDAYQAASNIMAHEYANKYADYWTKKTKTIKSGKANFKDSGRQKTYNAEFKAIREYKNITLEGGSIDVNGSGYLLTTKQCLLIKVQLRIRGFDKSDYYRIFNKYFGIKKIIWLNKGIYGDDTHGHIDDIARFIGRNKFLNRSFKNIANRGFEI